MRVSLLRISLVIMLLGVSMNFWSQNWNFAQKQQEYKLLLEKDEYQAAADLKLAEGEYYLNNFKIDSCLASFLELRKLAKKHKLYKPYSSALNVSSSIYRMQGKTDSAVVMAREILTIPDVDEIIQIDALKLLAGVKRVEFKLDSQFIFFHRALELGLRINDSLQTASTYLELSDAYLNDDNTEEALKMAFNAEPYFTDESRKVFEPSLYGRLYSIFSFQRNWNKAKLYVDKEIASSQNSGFKEKIVVAYIHLGDLEQRLGNFEESRKAFSSALEQNPGTYFNYQTKAMAEVVSCDLALGKTISSEQVSELKKVLKKTQDLHNFSRLTSTIFRAEALGLSKDEFYTRFNETWKDTNADEIFPHRMELLNTKYRYQKETKDFESALSTRNEIIQMDDDVDRDQQNSLVHDLEAKYNKEAQDREIVFLAKENEIKSEVITAKNTALWISIGAGLLLALLVFSLFRSRTIIVNQNEIISKSLKEKDTLLREIHHRVKNNLQVVSSLLRLQTDYVQDSGTLDVLKEGQNRVQSMSLIHENLYSQDNLSGIKMKDYLDDLIKNLFVTYKISDNEIKLNSAIDDIHLDVESVVPLGLIINELITNSLKYAFPNKASGEISVSLKERNSALELSVSDNGIGVENVNQLMDSNSFGFGLIKSFSSSLDADVSVKSEKGLEVKLVISDYKSGF